MPLYVYAIVSRPVPPDALSTGHSARLRAVSGVSVVAIVADRDEAPSQTPGALRKHDAVVRRIARVVPAVLPVRFGTLFGTDRSLSDVLRTWSSELQAALRLVDQREQMTLRLFGPAGAPHHGPTRPALEVGENAGTAYMLRRIEARARAQSAPELEPLREALGSIVVAERIARHDAGPLLLTAFHLIPRGRAWTYRRLLRSRAAALGLRAAASGPWPPYAFVPELHA